MSTVPAINQPAPDFSLPDLLGVKHSLSDYRGQVVVVNFWSAECPWSERVDRELLAALPGWGQAVALLPVASNASEPPELLARVAAARRLPLVLLDSEQQVADLYAAHSTPHLFIVDPAGLLRYHGAFDDVTFRQRTPTRSYALLAIAAVLSGGRPDPPTSPPYGCAIVCHSG
jgi:thiol-disulfide isomerase/thioredoxin